MRGLDSAEEPVLLGQAALFTKAPKELVCKAAFGSKSLCNRATEEKKKISIGRLLHF